MPKGSADRTGVPKGLLNPTWKITFILKKKKKDTDPDPFFTVIPDLNP
jgi:hypothetical protein